MAGRRVVVSPGGKKKKKNLDGSASSSSGEEYSAREASAAEGLSVTATLEGGGRAHVGAVRASLLVGVDAGVVASSSEVGGEKSMST